MLRLGMGSNVQRRHFLLGSLLLGCDMSGVGIGRGGVSHAPQPIPLGAATWEDGFYVDFTSLSGTLSADVTPDVGAVALAPFGSPGVDVKGIGGRPAVFLDQASSQHFSAHALATLQSGSDLPLTVIVRCKRDWPLGSRTMFGFGNSAQSANDYFDASYPGGVGAGPILERDAIAEAAKNIAGATATDYADHVFAFVFNGTTGWIYKDGAEVATGDLDTLALTPNRFTLGARSTTTHSEHLGGWISHAAMTGAALTPAQVATVSAAMIARDLPVPGKASGAAFGWFGDSITQGDTDTYATTSTRGGFRYRAYENWRSNARCISSVGRSTQGIFANPQHSAAGGSTTALIHTYMDTDIPLYAPKALFVMCGTNDADNIEALTLTMAAWNAQVTSLLADARTNLDALSAGRTIVVANLLPIKTGTAGALAIDDMNAELVSIWNAHDAANPTAPPLIRCDMHAAIGGVWHADYFDADPVHPNPAGYDLMGVELNTKCATLWTSL